MARPSVPQFGNWENEQSVPYTVYFEKARKGRNGKIINPNDPQENPDMFPNIDPSPLAHSPSKPKPRPMEPIHRAAVRPTPDHRSSREDSDFKHFMGQRNANELNYGQLGQRSARSARPSIGSEQSFERSPLHHDSTRGTPARARLRASTRGEESPDKGAAVPRFGDWNENDPQSAENFTLIFNKVRDEKNNVSENVSVTPKRSSYGSHGQPSNEPKKCCFPWW